MLPEGLPRASRRVLKCQRQLLQYIAHSKERARSYTTLRQEEPLQGPQDPFRILFFGRDEFSCQVFEQLHAARDVWESIDIATQPDQKVGRRGVNLSVSPLKTLGESLDVPVHTIPDEKRAFRAWQLPMPFSSDKPAPASHILVTASFGRILSRMHLDCFQPGRRLNVHPSLLPLYRGPAPIQRALLDPCSPVGVCVIDMFEKSKGIDTGDVWGHTKIARDSLPDEFPRARDFLAREGGRLLVSVLRDMLRGQARSISQDALLPRGDRITAEDALVDFSNMSADDIVRRHGAISHQKALFTHMHARTVQLHALRRLPPSPLTHLVEPGDATLDPHNKELVVRCMDGSLLGVESVHPQDRARARARDWWNGLKATHKLSRDGGSLIQLGRKA